MCADVPDSQRSRIDNDHARNRIIDFLEECARRQAQELVDTPVGFIVLHHDYPASYDHNKLVITTVSAPVDPVATAEQALAQAQRSHRFVVANRDDQGRAVTNAFIRAGYHHVTNVIMRYLATPPGPIANPAIHVVEASADELADFDRRSWRRDLPSVSAMVVEQLTARRVTRLLGADQVLFLAVRDDTGQVVASTDLYLDAGFGVAQVENVRTEPEHRNRGHARALLAEAGRHAATYGSEVLFLIADAHDWPRQLYARIGYVEIGRTHAFQRSPEPRWPVVTPVRGPGQRHR